MDNIEKAKKLIRYAQDSKLAIFDELSEINEGLEEVSGIFEGVDVAELEQLKGDKGDKGDRGEKGDRGPEGKTGPKGESIVGPRGPKGNDGKDANNDLIALTILERMPRPKDGKDGKDGSPDTPEEIRDKLQTLKKDKRLDKSAIKGLEDFIDQKNLDRALSILDQRTQFLINKRGGTGTVSSVVAGTNITVDNTDPANPIISATGGGGGTPGGSNTQVQFNDGGAFGGDSGLTFNKTTNDLSVGGGLTLGGDLVVFNNDPVNWFMDTSNSAVGYQLGAPLAASVASFYGANTGFQSIFNISALSADRTFAYPNASGTLALTSQLVTDHGALTGLSDDDHAQYALLAGRSGGQTLIGGTASGDDLTLQSTSNGTKGSIFFGTSAYDEVNNRLGIGTTVPTHSLTFPSTTSGIAIYNTSDQATNYERASLTFGSNIFSFFTEAGGSGATRNFRLGASNGYIEINTGGGGNKFLFTRPTATTGNPIEGHSYTMSASSGLQAAASYTPTFTQSGTAGYDIILMNPTETSVGSGLKHFLHGQVGSVDKFLLDSTGTITLGAWNGTLIGPTYGGTGVNNGSFTITAAANATISGTNTGDQASIVGITGTKAQFDTAVTDGNFLYVGDVTQYTDEMAQDAVGNNVGNGLDYDDPSGAISVDETELAHNSLGSKQGGTTAEYYHITAAQNTLVAALDADLATFSVPASTTISAFGATLVDDAAAVNARSTLGLVIGTDVQAFDADLTTLSTSFTSASASGPASLALHEDTDNGTNKITLTAPASIASDKAVTFQDIAGTVYVTGGTDVAVADGGTGLSAISALSILVANSANTFVELTPSSGQSIRVNAGGTAWEAYSPGAGGGDVTKVGTPVNNQIGVWTGDGTIEGDAALTFDTTTDTLTTPVAALTTIELGHASDTTLSRVSAGVVAVEGVPLVTYGQIFVVHKTGTTASYTAAADTDVSRGTALLAAMSAAVDGDVLYLSAHTFDIATSLIDLSLGGTGTVNICGSGKYNTVIKSSADSTAGVIIHPGNRSVTKDLSIIGTAGNDIFQLPWGAKTGYNSFVDVLLENVYISAKSDAIYMSKGAGQTFSGTIKNVTADTHWDCFVLDQDAGVWNIYDCVFTAVANADINSGQATKGMEISQSGGGTINLFNTKISASGGSVSNIGVFGGDNTLNIYGSTISTSGTGATDLYDNTNAHINVSSDNVFSTTSGVITPIATVAGAKAIISSEAQQLTVGGVAAASQVNGTNAASSTLLLSDFSTTNSDNAEFVFLKSGNALIGSATVVASGEKLGSITWRGTQQTGTFSNTNPAAQVRVEVDGTVTGGAGADMPGRIILSTTPDGSGTLTDRIILDSAGVLKPATNDGVALGTTALGYSDLHLATGALINVANGDAVITHSAGIFTVSTGDLRVTTAGTNAASVVTVGGTQTLTNKTLTSPTLTTPSAFTTGGTITLAENTSIALDPAGSADGKYSGITVTGLAGYTQAFGDLVTLDKDDSRWEAVDISVAAAATGDARGIMGMVVSAGTDGTACTILLHGIIRADANFPALTIGAAVYASTTGDIVVAQPTTVDHVIRIVGYALTADEIYFNPENDWITHT